MCRGGTPGGKTAAAGSGLVRFGQRVRAYSSAVDAVVMAAGEGTRLRPLTNAWPKPALPIDGRPIVVTLLHELRAAALGPVTVVTGYRAEQLELLLAGLDLRFVRQPRADGSADAVRRAFDGGGAPPAGVRGARTGFG